MSHGLIAVTIGVLAHGAADAAEGSGPRARLGRLLAEGVRVAVEVEDFGVALPVAEEVEVTSRELDALPGRIEAVDRPSRSFRLAGFTVNVPADTALVREPDLEAAFGDLRAGLRVKVEGQREGEDLFRAERIVVRRNQTKRGEKLVGPVEIAERSTSVSGRVRVLGRDFVINETTTIVDLRGREWQAFGWRAGTIDQDDLQMEGRIRFGPRIALSGEARFEGEALRNPRVDAARDDSSAEARLGLILGMAADFGPVRAYVEGQLAGVFTFDSEDPFQEDERLTRIREAYLLVPSAIPRLSLAVGRQKFDELREWHYKTRSLDAVRLVADLFPVTMEASIGQDLYDLDRDDDVDDEELRNLMLQIRWAISGDFSLEAFYVDRDLDDERLPISQPRVTGLRLLGEPGRHWGLWLDLARNTGTHVEPEAQTLLALDGDPIDTFEPVERELRGEALDAGVSWRPRVALDPTLTVTYAFGSGESDEVMLCGATEDTAVCLDRQRATTERNFYQTGLHRNADRYNGRSSFSYYGVALDPELANLRILTAAVGIRPIRELSLDVIYHHYEQDRVSRRAFDAGLREEPLGLDPDIGEEWDLVLGYRPNRRFELKINAGAFFPGDAFDPRLSPDPIIAAKEPPESVFSAVRFRARYRF